ncbi:hypothetical protein L226DRAFT_548688 [Lentinus tigrinus ALCF2SS1-7]|uniref:Uncharacterized protein n=1 Tax=Lentinus tigrinus ALCF2SS1-6 TaxID=1328759 RepID=A0A5C2RMZ4_9APHY|nr:hypothetical protein L227DRAFT_589607 [Lentinus tigrinus ALCF2SS1-6]RPD68032.1 hypothetical protein L226DRAFT_548688 [Lentinus tigrinus ALCF2SS1-7]
MNTRCFLLGRGTDGFPLDGVSVAKSITLKDKFRRPTRSQVTIRQRPAHDLLRERKERRHATTSPAAVGHIVEFLSAHAKMIMTTAEIAQISANVDAHLGNLIPQAKENGRKEGVITDKTEITDDMRFDRGFISWYFVIDARSPLVIVAEHVDVEAPAACVDDKLRGQLQVCAV